MFVEIIKIQFMLKYLLLFVSLGIIVVSCDKKSECANSECTIRTINLTNETVYGSWNNNPIDTIKGGDTIYFYTHYNNNATFTSNNISYTIKANDCLIDFPIF